METLKIFAPDNYNQNFRARLTITRVFGFPSLEGLYDFGRLPVFIGGNYGRCTWTAERGAKKWLNFRTWISFRERVFERDNFKCVLCGKLLRAKIGLGEETKTFVCDHIVPLFKGGKDWYEDPLMTNFQTLCEECNKLKTKSDVAKPKKAKEKAKLDTLHFLFEKPVDYTLDIFTLEREVTQK